MIKIVTVLTSGILLGSMNAPEPAAHADDDIVIGETACDRAGDRRILGAGTLVECSPEHVWERVGTRPGESA